MPKSKNSAVPLNADCLTLFQQHTPLGVAVSGGADSMALVHILRDTFPDTPIFAYTVDHGLRDGSAAEAHQTHQWLSPFCTHRVLTWEGAKPDTGMQDAARDARYRLLTDACRQDGVAVLCVAHHRDDQAETLLHRLAKGSGLDGLAGMKPVTEKQGVLIARPLLDAAHGDLVAHCRDHGIAWIEDPSNENKNFARVRLRHSRAALEAEGLSNERLHRLSTRMARARDALEFYTDDAFNRTVDVHGHMAVIAADARALPDEIRLRLILKAARHVVPDHTLASRLERLEEIMHQPAPHKTTLGGAIIDALKNGAVRVTREG